MATFECYACHAVVHEGMRNCASCGAEQTRTALERFRAAQAVRQVTERWRLRCMIAALAGLALGVPFGILIAPRMIEFPVPQAQAASIDVASLPSSLTIEHTNDVFMRSINEILRSSDDQGRTLEFGAVSWIWGPDSTYVIELAPPTVEQPGLWHVLSLEQRQRLMEFLGVSYTRALLSAGFPVDLAENHPPIALKYRGSSLALAIRQRDGAIRVFPSEFDPASGQQ